MEERLTELEIKVTFQEDVIGKLSDVIVELRAELSAIERRIKRLEQDEAEPQ